ncbi:cAMP-binding protein [Idiomarina sp. A28L]|uniref:Crp/Fnr family transcriptional regulator n=1 Tax=Idiomarina sp. A28L TaxID=1036674 RepID=UPI00021386F4|nr:Crp/Fnr family transcriptional regulator [Idiomarina sp. A28L]EGN75255.1 cAMP-binding protein [Idiomarina sp. A28L]
MSTSIESIITNHLIELIPAHERLLLLNHCEVVDLEFGVMLSEHNKKYKYLYFPMSGFISLVTKLSGHKPLEMSVIGNEGMLGVTMVLGVSEAPMQAVVQGKGTAWRLNVAELQQVLHQCPQLRHVLKKYLFVSLAQLSQSAACAHFHALDQRLARWLLLSQDRAHSNEFHLTHQFLADMLGVRRSGVTVAAGRMQERKLIEYSRGKIAITNRSALEKASCECYQLNINEYQRLLGEPAQDSAKRLLTEQGTP